MIELQDLSYVYGAGTPLCKQAIKHVNLKVQKGEFVAVIGPTGSGKSTLFGLLNGLKKPTGGQVLLKGQNIWQKGFETRQVRFEIGEVFQFPEHQIFEQSVFEELVFGLQNKGVSEDKLKPKALEALRFIGLPEDILGRSPFELSGGQKRKLAIASVVAMEPEVLVLDEPTAGLDPRSSGLLLNKLKGYQKQGKTVIWASHNMEEVAEFADRVVVLEAGRVKADGTVDAVFSQVKLLEEIGLGLPQISLVFKELKNRGFEVCSEVSTVKAGVEEFFRLKQKLGHKAG